VSSPTKYALLSSIVSHVSASPGQLSEVEFIERGDGARRCPTECVTSSYASPSRHGRFDLYNRSSSNAIR
jgi:hypothetical protein